MRFVLFDRILELKKGQELVLLKNVSQSEDFFTDHFPDYPVVPGSIILGSFEQGAEILLAVTYDFAFRPVLEKISRASFRRFTVPGDQLEIRLSLRPGSPTRVQAVARVQDRRVADALLDFSLVKADGDPKVLEACARLKNLYGLFTSNPLAKAWDLWSSRS